jgi:hypothetical protein
MELKKIFNKSQRLFIELGTSLLLELEDQEINISCELVGMLVGEYLIVHLTVDQLPVSFDNMKNKIAVKYLCSGDVFGFTSQPIHSIDVPDNLLFLAYPNTVDSCNVRARERVECFLPVQVVIGDSVMDATVVNMNIDGCLAIIDNYEGPVSLVEEDITVQFPYAGSNLLSVDGQIRSLRKQSLKLSLGIRFSEMDNFSRSILGALIPAMAL